MYTRNLHSLLSRKKRKKKKKKIQSSHPKSFKHWLLHYPPKSPNWFLPFRSSKQTLYSLHVHYMHATCHICIIFIVMIMTIICGEEYQSRSSLHNLLHPSISTSLHTKYSPHHPALQTLNLCFSLDVRHQISHPHKMTATMSVSYISTCNILNWMAASTAWIYSTLFFQVHGPQFLSGFNIY